MIKKNVTVRYRNLTNDDIDGFYRFFSKCVKEFFSIEYTPATIDHFLNNLFTAKSFIKFIRDGGFGILALVNGKISGFILQLGKEKGGLCYADWLAVDRKYQGMGIGTKLLSLWEKESLERGCHTIYLATNEDNIKYYEKRGFILMGLMKNGWFGADDYWMYKNIQEPKDENFLK